MEYRGYIVPKYPALQQRIQTPRYFSRSNPFSPQIDLERLDIPDDELLTQLGSRLLSIFYIAYSTHLDATMQTQNIATLSQAARDSMLAISHRRLFVKALVTEWYRQKEEGERPISSDYAVALIRGQSDDLMELADSQQKPY